jgi:Flp pilus assembly protein TadD
MKAAPLPVVSKQNRLTEAVQHLEQARTVDPKDKGAYSQLAIAYRRMGKPELAATMLATLNKLNDEERKGNSRQRLQIVKENQPTSN